MSKIQAKLSRKHLTATQESETIKRLLLKRPQAGLSATVPVRQEVLVELDSILDIQTCSRELLLAEVVEALPSAETLVLPGISNEWEAWHLDSARDWYESELPAAVELAEGSHAAMSLAASLASYPSLYGADAFAPYRVFGHWFLTIGNGLEWQRGMLLYRDAEEGAEAEFTLPLSADDYATELATFNERASRWPILQEPYPQAPVRTYPASPGHSALFDVPADVDDEYLKAAMLFCRYMLSRPVWQNWAYTPHSLVGTGNAPRVLTDGSWRQVQLADGMKYRTLIEQAYSRLVLGVWRPRLVAMGYGNEIFHPLNYELPPRMRSFRPNPILGV